MSFNNIQTAEQLKDYIHSIHDFIRNSGAGYGMSALKIFNVFYSLRLIKGKCKRFGLDENVIKAILLHEMKESKTKRNK